MPQLQRKLTLYGLTMIAVGACIGSGIFVTPATIVQALPNHSLVIIVWLLGGLLAMTGALTFAELGSIFPKAGGVYVFLKEAYGDLAGFLYGWVILLVINTGALAALSIAFAEYMTYFVPMEQTAKIVLASCTILGLTLINVFGVNISQVFANVFTGLKLAAIAGIIIAGFVFYNPEGVNLDFSLNSSPDNVVSALLLALIGVLFSIGGWHHASYLGSETVNASRTVPRAMVLGVAIVTVTYVLVNIAYMLLLPLDAIAGTERVAGDAVATIVPFGGKLVAVAIAISIFGTIGIYTMTAPRIYYAMAEDGLFFEKLSEIHPKYKTPVNAMMTQAVWAIVLLMLWGSFGSLIKYVTFMDIVFMTLAGISIFIFRKRNPNEKREVSVPLYPIVPLIFIIISGAFVINTLIEEPIQAGAALLVLAIGFPIYFMFKNKREKE